MVRELSCPGVSVLIRRRRQPAHLFSSTTADSVCFFGVAHPCELVCTSLFR